MGYSLWLVPPQNSIIATTLRSTIQSLDCSFAPHVTLVSKIPLSTPIDQIQSSLISYLSEHVLPHVHIQSLNTGSEFFKRIFLRCAKSDSLVSLARFSKETFVHDGQDIQQWLEHYDPHISLIYAEEKDCHDEELFTPIDRSKLIDQTWDGGQIHLVNTTEQLSQWTTVLEFDIPTN